MDKVAEPRLIKKGAEANLYLADWHDRRVVMKRRLPKKYRPPQLDKSIRAYRTIHEPQLMHEAKKAGVPTPTILLVNVKENTIFMDFIEGSQVKRLLNQIHGDERQRHCYQIGCLIGRLHRNGIIHGDLTTSNMILSSDGRIFFLDFGLGERSHELEAKGVDLHLMKRALRSTHFGFAEECFASVIKGYSEAVGHDTAKDVLDKIAEIERRGRYVVGRSA